MSHRDYYEKGAVTSIEIYDDRVEITNPGGLVSAIPESEFGKRSHSRNPLIFGLFARMKLVEQVGSGISRIKELMKNVDLPEPTFQKEGMFTVKLIRPVRFEGKIREKTREKTREKIINAIRENKQITTSSLAIILGITEKGIEYHLQKLKNEKKIERIGPDKGGHWKVVS